MKQTGQINFQNSTLHYHCWGNGPQLVLAFHGYGESGEHFSFLNKFLEPEKFTLLAVDFPFHGKSIWKQEQALKPDVLLSILDDLLLRFNKGKEPIIILGYSMGGRIALSILPLWKQPVKRMVLVATDGLHSNPWYFLATQTVLGNRLFKYTMNHPTWFAGLLTVAAKFKLVNGSVLKFVRQAINNPKIRTELYERWTLLRLFQPNKKALVHYIKKHPIFISLIYGKYDRIILPNQGKILNAQLPHKTELLLLVDGHQLLTHKNGQLIAEKIRLSLTPQP